MESGFKKYGMGKAELATVRGRKNVSKVELQG